MARMGLSLRKHLAQALVDAPGSFDLAASCALVQDLQDDVVALDRQVGGLIQFISTLGWLPGIGGDLRVAPDLLSVAQGLTEAGALMCGALNPALGALAGEGADDLSLEHVARLLDEEQAELERAQRAVE